MAVYTYSGTLTDFGEAPFPDAIPRLFVQPKRDAFTPKGPAAAKRIPVSESQSGYFTVELEASADLIPETGYSLRCEWLATADGEPFGWAQWDFTAQIGGGPIATMPTGVTRVWYATTKPPVDRQGIYWIHSTTGDVRAWRS